MLAAPSVWLLLTLGAGPEAVLAGPPPRPVPIDPPQTSVEAADRLKLQRLPDGGYLHKDPDAGFTAEIRPDGSVRFRDTHLGPQDPQIKAPGLDLLRGQPLPEKPFRDDLVPHGPYGPPPILFSFGMRFGGGADAALATRRYRAKQAFLDVTAPMRSKMAEQHSSKNTDAALVRLGRELVAIWKDAAVPLSIRKQRVFERWDGCSEAEPDDDPKTHPGERARRRIEKFIRTHAKPGTEHAYTDVELRRLNAHRRSKASFDPYRTD